MSSIRCLAARRDPEVVVRVTVGTAAEQALWEYEISLKSDSKLCAVLGRERVVGNGRELLSRPNDQDREDPFRLRQTHLEQVNSNREFRSLADLFSSIRHLHVVPQIVREPERVRPREDDPFGSDFLERIATTPRNVQEARLRRIVKVLRVAVPQLRELILERDAHGAPHLKGRYEHWRPRGAWQDEAQFSDGTLRLLGVLWAALDGNRPLLLEEPELSLHPEIVRRLPALLAAMQRRQGRQVLLSTHSPDMFQDEGIGLDEVLILTPSAEGTQVRLPMEIGEVPALLRGGSTLADVIVPRTKPPGVEQLLLPFMEEIR